MAGKSEDAGTGKRKRGRPPSGLPRRKCVAFKLSEEEVAALDDAADRLSESTVVHKLAKVGGRVTRGEVLRALIATKLDDLLRGHDRRRVVGRVWDESARIGRPSLLGDDLDDEEDDE